MIEKFVDGTLTIALSGKIDSGNATEAGEQMDAICAKYPYTALVLDLDDLKYISSAGLRLILRLRKKNAELKLINANSEVYEIFDMTGMSEMIQIEKALRKLEVEGCEVIGQGANGIVYRIDADTIVKAYRNPDSLPDIQRERELARKAFVLGIPTAIPYDIVRVGESYGSVFELLNAKSFSKLIVEEPENMDKYLTLYVDVMKKLHSTHVKPTDMPSMKEVAVDWAAFMLDHLPKEEGEKLYRLMKEIPERDTMLHGDYHTNNLMLQDGEALLIDMDTLCYGHPIFELASMYMGFVAFGELDPMVTMNFLKMPYELANQIWKKSLPMYLNTDDRAYAEEVENKAKLIAYTRLMRRTIRRNGYQTEEGKKVIENAHKNISALLQKLDTLNF